MSGKIKFSLGFKVVILLAVAFMAGQGIGKVAETTSPTVITATTKNWGLGFGEEGKAPTAAVSKEELEKYDAYYVADTKEKVLYLTFDAGFENGNTSEILDVLKKHQVTATFFLVGHYLESSPDLVKRMVDEGHIVGNHSYHHPDMSGMNTTQFKEELGKLENLFTEITGQEMRKYYRPPQGKYSQNNLSIAKELGYKTFFWSLAYVDWKVDAQPSKEEAMEKLTKRVHPGAIVLLHSTSNTNKEILDELLTKWKEMGYTFHSLDDFSK